jgi:3-oxoadipate enol-lactonase
MTELEEHVLERGGCPLRYWVGGPADRPLVVFTHGVCVDHHSFDPHVPVIAQRYRVLTWDVRGHGQSRPSGQPFSVPLAVEDLLALMGAIGSEKAAFVGHSNGTYISQELAFRHPGRVLALVIADGTCITWEMSALENWLVRVSTGLMRLFPYETLKKSNLPFSSAKPEVQDYVYRAFSQLSKDEFLSLWQGAATCLHPEPGYRIAQPMLLVHGDDDRMGNIAKISPAWARREPNCQYVVMPNTRHFATLDDPDTFNRLTLDFLSRWVP